MNVILFIAPIPIALITAFWAGHLLAVRAKSFSLAFKVGLGGLAGMIAPVVYLWIWQMIEVAIREARGDTSDYMGPMVLLVYGFPIFVIISILCFVLAASAIRRVK